MYLFYVLVSTELGVSMYKPATSELLPTLITVLLFLVCLYYNICTVI